MSKEYQSFVSESGTTMWAKVNTVVDEFKQRNGTSKETGYVLPVYFNDDISEKLKQQACKILEDAMDSEEYKDKKGNRIPWREKPRMPFKTDKEGKVFFNFRTSHIEKTGDNIGNRKYVPLYGKYKNKLDPMTSIGNGSVVKVSYSPSVFYISEENNGIKFYLNAIQILDLKEYKAGDHAFGFEAEDDSDETVPF